MICKWISDSFSEICTNADSPYCADFCPSTENPRCCVYYQEQTEGQDERET